MLSLIVFSFLATRFNKNLGLFGLLILEIMNMQHNAKSFDLTNLPNFNISLIFSCTFLMNFSFYLIGLSLQILDGSLILML